MRRKRYDVPFEDIRAFDEDRLLLHNDAAVCATNGQEHVDGTLTGKAVVSHTARYLGIVDDLYFDETAGQRPCVPGLPPRRQQSFQRQRHSVDAAPAIRDVIVIAGEQVQWATNLQ